MAELSLKDRLQPALLDRLTDDERTLTVFRLTLDAGLLREHGLTEADLERALALQGLRPADADAGSGNAANPIVRDYVAAGRGAGLVSPRALRIRSSGGQREIPLATVCNIDTVTSVNAHLESPERRAMSMSRLREAVLRDLGWLFNASGIDDVVDLEHLGEVRRSVLNYGLRSLAGRAVTSIDPIEVARRIRDAISFFEPRLGSVRVVPEAAGDSSDGMTMSFLVDAELWGQPVAQQMSLRTSIDVDTGDVLVADRSRA